MRRRHLVVLAVLAAMLPCAGTSGAATPGRSWAHAEIRVVVQRGLLADDVASFRPDDALTQGELAQLVAGLTGQPVAPVAKPGAPVTIAALDARLVRALELQDSAAHFSRIARTAGTAPPARFGTEVVARLLGLRKNHPAGNDALERLPNDVATRAEAAYSAARILRLSPWDLEAARALAEAFALPALTPMQRQVLATAFRLVGYPYVWGGESDVPNGAFGPQAQGGFDCSGFVWRVYKLQPYAELPTLAQTIRGRTTFEMSAEVPRTARVAFAALAPGDLVFFGAKGPRSKPAQVDHVGIYAGGGWIVHSSRNGVTLAPLDGWYRERFAWARRPLAEAATARRR